MRGDDIAKRLLALAVQALQLIDRLPNTFGGRHVADQLSRSATAPGAHYEEARGAESRKDFVHKVKLAAKELRETRYWLRICHHAHMVPADDLTGIIAEATELIAILTTSAKTASR